MVSSLGARVARPAPRPRRAFSSRCACALRRAPRPAAGGGDFRQRRDAEDERVARSPSTCGARFPLIDIARRERLVLRRDRRRHASAARWIRSRCSRPRRTVARATAGRLCLEARQRVAFTRPGQPLVERLVGLERRDRAGLHVANLDAVARLICCVDRASRDSWPLLLNANSKTLPMMISMPVLRSRRIDRRRAARVLARRVAAARRLAARRRAAPPALRPQGRPRRRAASRPDSDRARSSSTSQPLNANAADLRDRRLVAGGEVHDRHAVLIRSRRRAACWPAPRAASAKS